MGFLVACGLFIALFEKCLKMAKNKVSACAVSFRNKKNGLYLPASFAVMLLLIEDCIIIYIFIFIKRHRFTLYVNAFVRFVQLLNLRP